MSFEPFSAADVKPCRQPGAAAFTKALITAIKAEVALEKAKEAVPSYTGPNSVEDYYAEEQEAFNRAADDLALMVKKLNQPNRLGVTGF